MPQGRPNTEFNGEPAAVPSLVRCNSSFGGLVLLEIALQLHGTVEDADNWTSSAEGWTYTIR
jgi:hypothetical protein